MIKRLEKNTNKKINKRSNVSQPNFSKKKKKNKHTKNKGMRKNGAI
ncbi:hypothetical protein [Apilactobacillus ozensis]|nr:hypothetical protein [Apilactobacillus ozensis]